ncbi:hypothetical protein NE237_010369 [Protea cynaroides]|uniref:Uncharacterized protein n=1 Tax=Protea cynaroides TaxID=273540 RepID=A0A9Q0R1H9_9MAGN|nr:hypothetical protein NE237_010369 [Protea cynaroides]
MCSPLCSYEVLSSLLVLLDTMTTHLNGMNASIPKCLVQAGSLLDLKDIYRIKSWTRCRHWSCLEEHKFIMFFSQSLWRTWENIGEVQNGEELQVNLCACGKHFSDDSNIARKGKFLDLF